ncbi:MFS transporter [Rhizobium halophilum]|uniref:MFS transporter n=1 Tax=Rhizobium halophilum TaxID=2846852 RepID=UPI001EFE677E|nr:MFS transporter [Rhizobium halophilum]MCF6368727.1 MFS transporter [Rhizobium halophilum]
METRWREVAVAVLAGIAAALHVGKVPPALPFLRDQMGLDLVEAGWLMGLVSLMGGLLGLAVGRTADRLTPRRSMLMSLSLLALGSVLGAVSQQPAQLFATRIVEGIGLIFTVVAAPALITSATLPRDRGLAFAAWAAWLPIGVGSMMLASPFLLSLWGWRGSWIAAALLTVIPLITLARAGTSLGTALPSTEMSFIQGARLTAARSTSWLLAGMFLLYSSSFMSVFGFLPTMLIEENDVALVAASAMTATAVLANVPGNFFGGYLLRRGVKRWCLIVIAFSLLSFCAFIVFTEGLPLAARYPAALVYAAAGGLLPAAIMSALPTYAAREDLVSTISGFVMQGTNIGQFLGPLLLASVVTVYGWGAAPVFVLLTGGTGIGLAWLFRSHDR